MMNQYGKPVNQSNKNTPAEHSNIARATANSTNGKSCPMLEREVNRIIGTAVLKNDKNYSWEILALIAAERHRYAVEVLEGLRARALERNSYLAHWSVSREDLDAAITALNQKETKDDESNPITN